MVSAHIIWFVFIDLKYPGFYQWRYVFLLPTSRWCVIKISKDLDDILDALASANEKNKHSHSLCDSSIVIPFMLYWYGNKPFVQLAVHWKGQCAIFPPALMELQGFLAPPHHSQTNTASFLPALFRVTSGFSFPPCLLPEESQVSVFKAG